MSARLLVLLVALLVPDATEASPSTWETVSRVPPALEQQFQAYVLQRPATRQDRLKRIVEFMLAKDGLGIEYSPHKTLTVEQTFEQRRANCLSLTIMFVALAREAGLEAYVQEADDVLAWMEGDDATVVYYAGHVNAGARIWRRRFEVDFDRSVIAARAVRAIDDQRALAHFYNNLAAEHISAGDSENAISMLEGALERSPDFVPALHNLGVHYARLGLFARAERAYLAALSIRPDHVPTIANLAVLYRSQGNPAAGTYEDRRQAILARDPFRHYAQGLRRERRGQYREALESFEHATRLGPREPRFYAASARMLDALGDGAGAERQRSKARRLAERRPEDGSLAGFMLPYASRRAPRPRVGALPVEVPP